MANIFKRKNGDTNKNVSKNCQGMRGANYLIISLQNHSFQGPSGRYIKVICLQQQFNVCYKTIASVMTGQN